MSITSADVADAVSALFRQKRRRWKGLGGGGNPHETWEDLRELVVMALILDPDAVLTSALWASANLGALIGRLRATVSAMDTAAQQLMADEPPALADSSDIDEASWTLSRALGAVENQPTSSAVPQIELARSKIETFVRDKLAPVVSPGLTGQDQRTPAEARTELREQFEALSTELETLLADKEILDELMTGYELAIPPVTAKRVLRQVKADVDSLRTRFLGQAPGVRLSQARSDLIRLLADATALEQLGHFEAPELVRTTKQCVGYGSGAGGVITGTVSGPYQLLHGVTDQLMLSIDGGPNTQYDLLDQPNALYLDFPLAQPPVGWYVVPGPGPYTMYFLIDGRQGVAVTVAAGNWTVAALVALIAGTPGAIPENPPGSPFLTVGAFGAPPTVRTAYNIGVPTPANVGIGAYIEIRGDATLMNVFGFPGSDDGATQRTARVYWRATPQREFIDFLGRQMYDGGRLRDRAHALPYSKIVTSGTRAFISVGTPTTFRLSNYIGTGTWYPDSRRLTLSGDELRRVRVGDCVTMTGTGGPWDVESVLDDGVMLTGYSGATATGTYPTVICPPAKDVVAGMTLAYYDRGAPVYARILSAAVDASGYLAVGADRRPSLVPYTPINGVSYSVIDEHMTIQSADNSPAGSTRVKALGGADAAAVLGWTPALANSYVDQLQGSVGTDFVAAGVAPGDYIMSSGSVFAQVQAVLSARVVQLDRQIVGTTAITGEFRNQRYHLYTELLAGLAVLDTAPEISTFEPLMRECLRAPKAYGAVTSVRALLATLDAALAVAQYEITAFRAASPAPSPVLSDCRQALEDSGADRALWMLTTARVGELLAAGVDDASYGRRLLREVRRTSRTMLGTSVFAPAIRQEAEALAVEDPLDLGVEFLRQDEMGAPWGTRR